ncbi:MAG TPA: MFS transporter, partial [Acidimicrobiales bacterium]|nr:MFS transporter [Acidimicrobiales bacterium]
MTASADQVLVDDIVETREQLRAAARASLGVTGDATTAGVEELRSRYGLPVYPLVALAVLAVVDQFQTYAFTVLTPDISRALGLSLGVIAGVIALKTLAILVAPLPIAWLSQARSRRALLCVATGLAWSVMTLFTGFVTSLIALILVLVVDGLTTGSVIALHQPLLMDTYPPEARVRALSFYRSAYYLGNVGSPLLVALLAGVAGLTWRGVFLAMGLVSIGMTLCCVGLRDPGFGRWDTDQIRAKVHEASGDDDAVAAEDVELGFWEICRRLLLIPTWRRVFAGYAVYGLLYVPLQTFLSFFLEQRWNLGPGSRGLFFAYVSGAAVLGLVLYGRRGEAQFRASPARVPRSVGLFLGFGVALIAAGGLAPSFGLMAGLMGLGFLMFGPLNVGLAISGLSVIPSRMRPHAEALGGIFIAIGGVVGALFFSGISRRYGIAGSMVSVAVPGIAAAWIIASAGRYIGRDLDRMIDEILEDTEIKRIRASGGRLPMLACRGIDFSYGQLQVLFDVDFTVDDGEMVALLGVNGAGKSTLLKVTS